MALVGPYSGPHSGFTPGPRIYNLFPLLAGPLDKWAGLLPSVAAMGFDWVYVNPFHYPGFSGSLYAIKDLSRLHPLVQGDSEAAPETLIQNFTAAAKTQKLAVMLDLVINHSARDSVLAEQHPDWYRHEADGALYSPRAVDPVNPDTVTIWGDLAEFDLHNPQARAGLIALWQDYIGNASAASTVVIVRCTTSRFFCEISLSRSMSRSISFDFVTIPSV